ncbi:MAG: stage II sporulation protein D [Oscillospiraceae bacterium]|nr:stage II sporulation protein D [Oscillospiraceae bacterium]
MRWKVTAGLLAAFFLFFIPYLLAEDKTPFAPQKDEVFIAPPSKTDGAETITVLIGDTPTEMTMQDYLCCVVRAEMPASFELEALKAQAVAARTFTRYQLTSPKHASADICADSTCCQAFITAEKAAQNWGDDAARYESKIQKAVYETDGEVILYEGEPILAAFHSSSAGRTKDVGEVWLSSLPYLKSVESPEGEDTVPNFTAEVSFTPAELKAALAPIADSADFSAPADTWLGDMTLSESGGVTTLTIGGAAISGTALRTALDLRSTTFTAAYEGGEFVFRTQGYGHGVGLSQYGANTLASQGLTYRQILEWYYTDISIESGQNP